MPFLYLCADYYARMRIIKKLDLYILKNYLLLFAGTFFICLFIFIMQFIWQYIDDLFISLPLASIACASCARGTVLSDTSTAIIMVK